MSRPVIEHLYFHIPFCPKLCPYCCFYVEVGAKNKTTAFLDALILEVSKAKETYDLRPRTIYFGGGTPSSLLIDQLEYLLSGLRERLPKTPDTEWTFEVNPATVRTEKAKVLHGAGINRISLGVQSWNDQTLKTLGRVHNAAQAEKTFHILRDAGFTNINIDLMFSVPGQTIEQWNATLEKTIALNPEHISSYCLTYEEDTEYFRKLIGKEFVQDIDKDADLFELTMKTLTAAGYCQYEISNYARVGHESRHNQACWVGEDYLGFGPSAFSTVGTKRWENIRSTEAYISRIQKGEEAAEFREELSPATRRGEIIAFELRTAEGVSAEKLRPWQEEVSEFVDLGLLEKSGAIYRLTFRGRMLADSVAEAFV